MTVCARCQTRFDGSPTFCANCGAPMLAASPVNPPAMQGYSPAPSPPYAPPAITWRSGQVFVGRPLEIWIVIGLLACAALVYLFNTYEFMRYFSYMDSTDQVIASLGFLAIVSLAAGVAGVGLLIYRAQPAAWVLGLAAGLAVLLDSLYLVSQGATGVRWIILVLVSAAWMASLALLPAVNDCVNEWLSASRGRAGQPEDVVAARVLAGFLGVQFALTGLLQLVAHYEAKSTVLGLFDLVAAGAFGVGALTLRSPDLRKRLLLSVAAGAGVLLLVAEDSLRNDLLKPTLCVLVGVLLWVRQQAKDYFPAVGG
jgi:hypothetical protein